MSDYTITVKVPFTYDGEGNVTAIGLAYLLDAIADEHLSSRQPEGVTIRVKKHVRS
jgi:hypothetical protein